MFAVVLVPTAVGVGIRHRLADLARRLHNPVRVGAAVLLVVAPTAGIAGGRTTLIDKIGMLSAAVVAFVRSA